MALHAHLQRVSTPSSRAQRPHNRFRSTQSCKNAAFKASRPLTAPVYNFRESDPQQETKSTKPQTATPQTSIPPSSTSTPTAAAVKTPTTSQQPTEPAKQTPHYRYPEEDPSIASLSVGTTVLGIILGGGAGNKLYPLTLKRAKPAIPIGANYRLIDITVSNCLNSGLEQVYCLTQYNSASLNRHLQQVYQQTSCNRMTNMGFVEALPAAPTTWTNKWAQGSADAVKLHMWVFEEAIQRGVEDFLILSGDHLYRMDYRYMLREHRQSGADITIAALPADAPHAPDMGLMKVDPATHSVSEFIEKPPQEVLASMSVDTSDIFGLTPEDAQEHPYIASMGVYAIKASVLKRLLSDTCKDCQDFGREVIPAAKTAGLKLNAFPFTGFWQGVNTISDYYAATMALTTPGRGKFDLYDQKAPLLTLPMLLPPSKVGDAELTQTLVGDGTVVRRGTRISNSVLGVRSMVGKYCVVEDTVMMGADYYETRGELKGGKVGMGIGDGCIVRKAIIDKNARIGNGCTIVNKDGVVEGGDEKAGWVVVDGIVVVVKGATLPTGTII